MLVTYRYSLQSTTSIQGMDKKLQEEKKQLEKLGPMKINVEKMTERMDVHLTEIKEKLEHAMQHSNVDPSLKAEIQSILDDVQANMENVRKLREEVQNQK
uniref:Epidermal growth factor receptor substrate 15-like 1 n=1 Tax=Lygus hesperus TaxID=30085 RepID=A0A0A9YR91_LYGHE